MAQGLGYGGFKIPQLFKSGKRWELKGLGMAGRNSLQGLSNLAEEIICGKREI